MTIRKHKRRPILGPAFDADQMNDGERIAAYVAELRYYRPRGFSKLAIEGERIARAMEGDDTAKACEACEQADEWKDDVDTMLTEWARRVSRNPYIVFGCFPHSGDVGFMVDADAAIEDADHIVNDRSRDRQTTPRGFSGMLVHISDHGNVSAYHYSNGRNCRELFADA